MVMVVIEIVLERVRDAEKHTRPRTEARRGERSILPNERIVVPERVDQLDWRRGRRLADYADGLDGVMTYARIVVVTELG